MGTILRSSLARGACRAGTHQPLALLPLLLALACSGSIVDGAGFGMEPGAGPAPVDPVTGLPTAPPSTPGVAPTPLPESAPTTGPVASRAAASSRFARLNHRQWENTVRDLLRLPAIPGLSRQFVNEGVRTTFDTAGGELEISAQLWQDYNKAAASLANQVVRDAAKLNALMPANAPADGEARARAFITSFGLRAFRRPLTDAEVTQYLELFRKGPELVASGNALLDGLELVVTGLLNSPHLLYRTELSGEASAGKVVLSDYEVATRLSYGLTNTMPDDMLFSAAGAKQLRTRDQVLAQARRLLESAAGKATVRDLHDQMIKEVDPSELVRDTKLHPLFKAGIGVDMKEEALAFVNDVIFNQGKTVTELLTAPYSFINAKLAPLYGVTVPNGQGDRFVKVNLDPTERAGLYTQLGFLSETATDYNPRPIKRGVHLSEHLLCNKVPPPPPEANQTPIPMSAGLTNRQAFEQATESPGTVCAGCHGALINPLGFAFERYDGLGRFRSDENGKPINTTGKYEFAEGVRNFNGAAELMKIAAEGRQVHECYSKQLLEYVYGRSADRDVDAALITELGRRSRLQVPIKDLMLDLVATEAFLTRVP
jgi:hypothetical protein